MTGVDQPMRLTPRMRILVAALGLLVAVQAGMIAWSVWSRRTPPAVVFPPAPPEAVAWFEDARFGLFIHWGPVSLLGEELSHSRHDERRPSTQPGRIPAEEYDQLYLRFNPVRFDAEQWVRIARSAGARYLVFVAKHHDGFCMYDSRLTDYKITRSPWGRDPLAELAAACRAASLPLGLYYSAPDWLHPDFNTPRYAEYNRYMRGQLTELLTGYGPIRMLWFDSQEERHDYEPAQLFALIRSLQPAVLMSDRPGPFGDFQIWERAVGQYDSPVTWETCETLGEQWSFRPDDRIKTPAECIRLLVACAGRGGNLLLNVGPMPTGEIEPRQVAVLEEVGAWLTQHGESIYRTRKGPFEPGSWGVSTQAGDRVYLHIMDWAADPIVLPALERRILRHHVLTGGTAEIRQDEHQVAISVPVADRHPVDTIIMLELNARSEGKR